MKDFGTVKSAVRPEPLVVDDFSVWINSDVEETTTPGMDGVMEHGFQYRMIQYTKDEYIRLMAEQNTALGEEVTNLQLALCDVYEMMG